MPGGVFRIVAPWKCSKESPFQYLAKSSPLRRPPPCWLRALPAASAPEEGVLRATLDNGLHVIIVRNPLAPVVTEIVNYHVGSADTPPGFPGTAHAEEHMVAGRSSREVSAAQVASIETLLGGDSDADTQNAVTQYYVTMPSRHLDVALHIEAARMRGALDLQSEWNEERGAIEQEVSQDLSERVLPLLRESARDRVRGNAVRPRRAGHARLVRQDDRPDAQALLRHLVRSEQRDPGDLGRRRPAGDAGAGQRRSSATSRGARSRPTPRSNSARLRRARRSATRAICRSARRCSRIACRAIAIRTTPPPK